MDGGLIFEDIQAAGPDLATGEGIDQRGFVHDSAARCVDDNHAALHLGEFGRADDVACVVLEVTLVGELFSQSRLQVGELEVRARSAYIQRQVQRQHITCSQELLKAHILGAPARHLAQLRAIVILRRHAKSRRLSHQITPDAAHA